MQVGSGGAQETVGRGNICAVEQWKTCVGAVKKAPGKKRGYQVTQPHLPAQFNTHFKEREGETACSMCTIHRNPGMSLCVCFCVCTCVCLQRKAVDN